MRSHRLIRRLTVAAGGTAIIAMVGFTAACGNNGGKTPETTPTTTTAPSSSTATTAPAMAPAMAPSEKSLSPSGGNLFTPNIHASQQYTPYPGHH
jgi:hypothetical protein